MISSFQPDARCVWLHEIPMNHLIKQLIVLCWMHSEPLKAENPRGNCWSQQYSLAGQSLGHSQDSSQKPVMFPQLCFPVDVGHRRTTALSLMTGICARSLGCNPMCSAGKIPPWVCSITLGTLECFSSVELMFSWLKDYWLWVKEKWHCLTTT